MNTGNKKGSAVRLKPKTWKIYQDNHHKKIRGNYYHVAGGSRARYRLRRAGRRG